MEEITLDNYLNSFTQTTDFPSLDGTLFLLNKLDNPHKKLKFIHVAGTNGKGSIVEMLNSILINSGKKVGKFISPHLIKSNESICINNIQINNSEIQIYIEKFKEIENEFIMLHHRSFTRFEIITSLAIDYFYKNNTDIVILEVGLGGLFDCTNVVTPIVSVFGSISFDHTQILGNTLKEITIQKGGIIKKNSKSVIFNQECVQYLKEIAERKNNDLKIINESEISNYSFDENYQYFEYEYNKYKINLKGKKQIENTVTVLNVIKILNEKNFNISYNTIYESLSKIIHPGRFETINKSPLIIFDGAHNENALSNFMEGLNSLYFNKNKTFIISIIKTKDYKKMIDTLTNNYPESTFIFTSGNSNDKFFDKELLFSYAQTQKENNSLQINIYQKDITDAINYILKDKNQNSINLVIGSFYVYNTVIKLINN